MQHRIETFKSRAIETEIGNNNSSKNNVTALSNKPFATKSL